MRPSRTWSSTSCSRSFCSASAKPSAPTPSPSSCSTSTNELVARAAKGLEEEVEVGTRIPVGQGFAGRVAAERRTVTIDDVDHAGVLNPILREKGVKSLLGAPLIAGGRVLGVVHVGTLTPRAFHDGTPQILQFAADRAALAIDHGRAYAAARGRRPAAPAPQRHRRCADEPLDERVARRARRPDARSPRRRHVRDPPPRRTAERARRDGRRRPRGGGRAAVRIPVGRGFAGRVAADIRPVVVSDVDRADIYNPILREKGIKSLLGAPLLAGGRLLGVIHVGTLTPRTFTAGRGRPAPERRRACGSRPRARDGLRAADRARPDPESLRAGRVARAASPTAAVLGSALTLHARAGALAPDEEEALRTILAEQAQRLATVVDQLLDLSRLGTRAVEIRRERDRCATSSSTRWSRLSPDQRARSRSTSIRARGRRGPVASSASCRTSLRTRSGRVRRPSSSPRGGTDGELELVVEDGGAGVPEDVRARLFDEFVRSAESATTSAAVSASPSRGRMRTPRAATCSSTVRATAAHAFASSCPRRISRRRPPERLGATARLPSNRPPVRPPRT